MSKRPRRNPQFGIQGESGIGGGERAVTPTAINHGRRTDLTPAALNC